MIEKEKESGEESNHPSRRNFLIFGGTLVGSLILSANERALAALTGSNQDLLSPNSIPEDDRELYTEERLADTRSVPQKPSTHLAEIPSEQFEKAEKILREAYAYIQTKILPNLKKSHPGAKKNGLEMVQNLVSEPFDPQQYIPLMVKESHLNPKSVSASGAKGLFQIRSTVIKEIREHYGYSTENPLDPLQNAIAGILFLHRCRKHYANQPAYQALSKEDKHLLAYAIFNKGHGNLKSLVERLNPKSYRELEQILSDAMVLQLTGKTSSQKSALKIDPTYGIEYQEYPGVTFCLDPSKKSQLERRFKLKGKDTALVLRQVGEVLRYVRMIEGIEEMVTPQEHKVVQGETLWRIGYNHGVSVNYLMRENNLKSVDIQAGQAMKVPAKIHHERGKNYFYNGLGKSWIGVIPGKGFYTSLVTNEAYNKYLEQEVELDSEDIEEVIIEFNRQCNPELSDLDDHAGNIPEGAFIWIPNVQYFIDYFGSAPSVANEEREKARHPANLNPNERCQYVVRKGSNWQRDRENIEKGKQPFPIRKWEDHPKWDQRYLKDRTLFKGRVKLEEVRFIVLHSTASATSKDTIRKQKAHFVVERDGTIRYLVPVKKEHNDCYKVPPHAGKSFWQGTENLNRYSIGIEVVAEKGQDWSNAQYGTMKQLVHWLGGYFELQKADVVLHKQVAYSRYGRGRKSDPYGDPSLLFKRLDLPDNSCILDLEVCQGKVKANANRIRTKQDGHINGAWDGLDAGATVRVK